MFGRGDDSFSEGASWWARSKKDPRFNLDGQCSRSLFAMEAAAREAIEKKAKELNAEPPDDLEIGGMKD